MDDTMKVRWHRITGATVVILFATILLWILHP